MYYSKRQLYALGEPLGDCVTQRKAGGGMIYGGGGSSGPTSTTVTNTNIPDYAQPYVSNMLNAAQSQIFNPSMTGFNAYNPYSTNPQDYVASFSPLQQQAQSTAANMQMPAEYGMASQGTQNAYGALGGIGTEMGGLGNQMGNVGQQIGGLGSSYGNLGNTMGQAGANYQNAYANPSSAGGINQYMNPYLQASLQPQLNLANQQYGQLGAQEQAQATQNGAFGGSREALMAGLNQQNQMMAQNQIIQQGMNTGFQNAQQAQQFGANLGLQGQQQQLAALQGQQGALQGQEAAYQNQLAALQGQAGTAGQQGAMANQLAGIGGQNLAAQQGIANLQNTYGGQQQANQQNIINQAIQNYATSQQYPFMQLGMLNSMLRGLPMQQSSTSMYQAAPSAISQLAGLGTAGLGATAMYNQATKAKGGKIKGYAPGGAIPMNMMSNQQLQQVGQSPASSPQAKMVAQGLEQLHGYMDSNPQAKEVMSQPLPTPESMAQAPQNRAGVGAIGTGNMANFAGGGIIAFAGEGPSDVKDRTPDTFDMKDFLNPKDGSVNFDKLFAARMMDEMSNKNTVDAKTADQIASLQKGIDERKAAMGPEALTRLGLGLMNAPAGQPGNAFNQLVSNIGRSGLSSLDFMSKQGLQNEADRKLMMQQTLESAKADQARRDALTGVIGQAAASEANKRLGAAQVNATRQAGLDAKEAALINSASASYSSNVERLFRDLATQEKNAFLFQNHPDYLYDQARRQAWEAMPEKTRSLLGMTTPPEVRTAPAPAPAAPPDPSIMSRMASSVGGAFGGSNPSMPTAPTAQLHWDPSANGGKGALVTAQ